MATTLQSSAHNRLLALMAPRDFALLRDIMQPVVLNRGYVLSEANAPIDHVFFIEHGIALQIATTTDNRRHAAGLYGREGYSGTGAMLGVDRTPYQHVMQVAGSGHRIDVAAFLKAADSSGSLRSLLFRFAHVLDLQVGYMALCNASCSIIERLAQCILMYQDRLDGSDLFLTHQSLGTMLKVRRAGITDALHILEGEGLIRSTRGLLRIVDRVGLIEFAVSYGQPEAEYERLIGPFRQTQREATSTPLTRSDPSETTITL